MALFDELKEKVQGKGIRLVFPEGEDARIQGAVVRLAAEGLITPVLLGDRKAIDKTALENGIDLNQVTLLDPKEQLEADQKAMVAALVERRNKKTDEATAKLWLEDVNYFGTMMVQMGQVDGMVSGASHPTGDTVRPALQLIKTAPFSKRISGAFFLQKDGQRYVFADCAINIELDAETMAQVALQSAETAKAFGLDPKIAMLSFSTKGSAKGEMVDKVKEATQLAKEMAPEMADRIDGELQFDAALIPSVGQSKAPNSAVAGQANVFVFPSLEAGNIGYKIAQRLGGFEAMGPILQGLAKPVSDLSRGCSEEDVYKVAIITAIQVQNAR
ncbi:phosphate acetyltransferase [Fructobacillus sp. M1-13]|uniref:Phosphate acetyltransferase n=1 Tax=Fructobacillus papyriferae TaxID=2713171 RepID=A0ABS5QN90_9LACO|nr:phosphate acetyltransferase [Fructobacillus papyriferae]MBS9334521.1 phosphate acetyltransferase [Fructobacillus papyriferae]MCD2158510.1 phosphate acetyltransferase [Fructobacillus papyriferae]